MTDLVSKKLEMAILAGKLKPREHLVELELSSKLKVSRFHIRKAFHEIARKGLIELFPNRGARVVDPSEEEVEDMFFVRLNLELLAAEVLMKKITPAKLEKIKRVETEYRKILKQGSFEEMIFKNEEFHHTLYEATENKFLQEFLHKVRNISYFLRYNAYFLPGRPQKSVNDHQSMIRALEQGDLQKLKSVIENSVLYPMNIYLKKRKTPEHGERAGQKVGV